MKPLKGIKGMSTGKGWHNYPIEHGLASKGIKTANKNLHNKSYPELKQAGIKLHPLKDTDKDKVKNYKDCKPLDPNKQDTEIYLAKGKLRERISGPATTIVDIPSAKGKKFIVDYKSKDIKDIETT